MAKDTDPYLIRTHIDDYHAFEAYRLSPEALEEKQLYYLMMRARSTEGIEEAVMAPAYLRHIQPMGRTALDVLLVDGHYEPRPTTVIKSTIDEDNYWHPVGGFGFMNDGQPTLAVKTGYLFPYIDPDHIEFAATEPQ